VVELRVSARGAGGGVGGGILRRGVQSGQRKNFSSATLPPVSGASILRPLDSPPCARPSFAASVTARHLLDACPCMHRAVRQTTAGRVMRMMEAWSGGEKKEGTEAVGSGIDRYNDMHDGHVDDRNQGYAELVNTYYNLATDFYEWGWGQVVRLGPARTSAHTRPQATPATPAGPRAAPMHSRSTLRTSSRRSRSRPRSRGTSTTWRSSSDSR
jgi:hypothetical protein